MAVVDLEKLTLVGLNVEKDRILERLMAVGVVHLNDLDLASSEVLAQWSHLITKEDTENAVAELDTEIEQTKQALDRLAKYVGDKKAMFVPKRTVTVDEFAAMAHEQSQCRQIVYDILRLKREQQELQNEKNKILNLRATLEPWQALPVPLDFAGTKYTRVMLGMLPLSANLSRIQEDLETQVPASHLAVIASDKYQHYSMLVCHRQCQADAEAVLRKHGFAPASFGELSGTVAANIQRANEEAAALERAFQEKEALIAAYAADKTRLELYYDYLVGQREKLLALTNLAAGESVFLIDGWVPKAVSAELKRILIQDFTCIVETRDPADDEEFPVLLENNSLGASVEGITAMYGLPNCREFDPNVVMAPFFIGFFGLMLGDGGYGLIMALGALFAMKKLPLDENQKKYAKLVLYCGISTMFWGLMFGSWFGLAYFAERPLWLNPVKDTDALLTWSLLFGVVHMFVGIAMRGVNHIRRGKYIDVLWDVVAWYVLFTGFILILLPWVPALNLADPSAYTDVGKKMLLIGAVVLILTQGRASKGIIGKLLSGVGSLYDLIGFLSDVLSYSRLLALGLATSVIGSIVNEIAALGGLNSIIKILVFCVIFIIGHSINFGINALGSFVHSIRLQYIEFFGKFYQGGGKPFQPLKYKTKYVNLKD